jgi:LPS export ABC transporter protein LptC
MIEGVFVMGTPHLLAQSMRSETVSLHFMARFLPLFCWVLMGLSACDSDIEAARELANTDDVQMDVATDVRLMHKEAGKLTALITAPLMHRFFRNENRVVFPEGLLVELYDNGILTCTIRAGYGQRDESTKRMTASGGVTVLNYKQEQMDAEEMLWDEVRQEITVEGKVKVTTPTDVLYGLGLVADDRFKNYTMKRITGVVEVEGDNIPGR